MRGAERLVHGARPQSARVALAALLLVGAAGGCASDTGQDARLPRPEATTRSGPDLSDADLWLSFERTTVDYDGSTAYPDALGGPFAGRVVTANGGQVEEVSGADGRGTAVAFPAKCAAPSGCP